MMDLASCDIKGLNGFNSVRDHNITFPLGTYSDSRNNALCGEADIRNTKA
jgi:hypothetical protein